MQILEDLHIVDIRPDERTVNRKKQYRKAIDELVKAEENLSAALSEKQKKLLESFTEAQREVGVLTDCESFCCSFKLCEKIILDVLTDGQIRQLNIEGNYSKALTALTG